MMKNQLECEEIMKLKLVPKGNADNNTAEQELD